jgi:hypothetical protein
VFCAVTYNLESLGLIIRLTVANLRVFLARPCIKNTMSKQIHEAEPDAEASLSSAHHVGNRRGNLVGTGCVMTEVGLGRSKMWQEQFCPREAEEAQTSNQKHPRARPKQVFLRLLPWVENEVIPTGTLWYCAFGIILQESTSVLFATTYVVARGGGPRRTFLSFLLVVRPQRALGRCKKLLPPHALLIYSRNPDFSHSCTHFRSSCMNQVV